MTPATPSVTVATPFSGPSTSVSSLSNFVLLGHPRPHHHQSGSPAPSRAAPAAESDDFKAMSVKPALIDAIKEVIDELETVYDNVSKNARDHIHSE